MSGALADEDLGKEALRRKFITPEQLRDALAVQAGEVASGRTKPRTLSNILISKGFLTPQQFADLHKADEPPAANSRYSLKEEIARGGMGAILRVSERQIRRDVAMKVMLDDSDEGARSRFLEEAQVTGQLEHPNIVPVHELGTDPQGHLFFTMKLVKGRSLGDVLKELRTDPSKELSSSRAKFLNILVNVCNAIAFAHSKGVVHRDLKPANIMLGDFGEVLVMDWGLAKVGAAKRSTGRFAPADAAEKPAADERLAEGIRSLREETGGSRTMDGAIMGTPHYMPPEQACGDIARIDERSDIYSLGAILYEILTLLPPVEGKTLQALIRNVADGVIVPPEVRTPARAVPRELSAIALKALAKNPADRYGRVEDLKRDLELYLEGRAVSAKHDTAWETLVKLVRRNRGVSIASALALAILLGVVGVGYGINLKARLRAEESERKAITNEARADDERRKAESSLGAFKTEEAARTADRKTSAPIFLAAAQRAAQGKDLESALLHVGVAASYDPSLAEARLLQGQLLLVKKEYPNAARELEAYVTLQPKDADADALLRIALKSATQETPEAAAQMAEIFTRQKLFAFVDGTSQSAKQLHQLHRGRLEQAWPGSGKDLALEKDGLRFSLNQRTDVVDLDPLRSIPLVELTLTRVPVTSLEPLRGMPLRKLSLWDIKVSDLSPLRALPLAELEILGGTLLKDLSALQGLRLRSLRLVDVPVSDFSPLRGMPLESLEATCRNFADLTPLKGAPLKSLSLWRSDRVRDLEPLRGMPLEKLNLASCKEVSDLSPLERMPLTSLELGHTSVMDLTPLGKLPLKRLGLRGIPATDFRALRDLPLESLEISGTRFDDLTLLKGKPLTRLEIADTAVPDISLLSTFPLVELNLSKKWIPQAWEFLHKTGSLNRVRIEAEGQMFHAQHFLQLSRSGLRESTPIRGWKVLGPLARDTSDRVTQDPTLLNRKLQDHRGRPIEWKPVGDRYDQMVNLDGLFGAVEEVIAFAVAELPSEREETRLLMGASDDDLALWLNGVKVLEDPKSHPPGPRGFSVQLPLKAGNNVLLLRCGNINRDWFFSASIGNSR